jgi:hypothetical protein
MYRCSAHKPNPKEQLQAEANLTSTNAQVGTTRDTNLVLLVSLVPDRAATLSNGHQLSRDAVREQGILALVRLVKNPLDGGTAALTQS